MLDDDNSLGRTTLTCVSYAVQHGYAVEFHEPSTPWWLAVRELLRDKRGNAQVLRQWADKLACLSRGTHRVAAQSFRRRMAKWRVDLTVQEVVDKALSPEFQAKLRANESEAA